VSGKASIDRGKRAERAVCAMLGPLLGIKARRSRAGHPEDLGDVFGVPGFTVQVADWSDALRAVREKPIEAEEQRARNGHRYASTFVKLRGNVWRVVLTPEQWASMVQELCP